MRKNALNVAIFLFLAGVLFFLWQHADQWFPKPEKKEEAKKGAAEGPKKPGEPQQPAPKSPGAEALAALGGGPAAATGLAPKPKEPPKVGPAPPPSPPPPPPEPPTLIALGEDGYYNRVLPPPAAGPCSRSC
jgi:hypothetical protein